MITPLTNPDFLPAVLCVIGGAKKSIVVVNFLAAMGEGKKQNPVFEIAKALAKAKRRGAVVSVFLEGLKFENNYPFYRYLKDRGVDVWLDTSKTFIHEKMLMADESCVIAGSHNLTAGAFFQSEEFSVMTDDAGVVQAFGQALSRITVQRNTLKGRGEKELIILPFGFVKQVIPPLYRACAELAFNLYLMLCLEDGGKRRPLPIDAQRRIGALGLGPESARNGVSEKYRRHYYDHRMNRLLGQLKKINAISVNRDNDTIERCALDKNFSGKRPRHAGMAWGTFGIPAAFIRDGWLFRLSFRAKYFYTISLVETIDSPFHPWWSLSERKLTKKYICDYGILKGALELEKMGVLEILRGTPVKRGGVYSEEAQYYRLNPL